VHPRHELSEPLVNIRRGLDDLRDRGVLTVEDERGVLDRLESMWFGERTLAQVCALLKESIGQGASGVLEDWTTGFDRFWAKSLDLIEFLATRGWETT
jgi:hypothetical protein